MHEPEFMVTEIEIRIRRSLDRVSHATVTYRRSALTEQANVLVQALTPEWAEEQARHWGAAITAALHRSPGGG